MHPLAVFTISGRQKMHPLNGKLILKIVFFFAETERVNETESLHRSRYGAEDGTPEKVALNDDLLSSHNATSPSNVPLSRKSSEISSHNIKQQRKQSEIYEKIGKVLIFEFNSEFWQESMFGLSNQKSRDCRNQHCD